MRTGDLTQEDLALQAKLLEHGILFPVEFKSKLRALILDSMRTLPMTHMEEGMLMRAAIIRPDGHEYGYQWGFNDADGPHATYQSCDPQRIATGIANGRYLVMLNIAEFSAAASGAEGALSFNGEEPDNQYAVRCGADVVGALRPRMVTLSNNNENTMELKIKILAATHASWESAHVALFRLGT